MRLNLTPTRKSMKLHMRHDSQSVSLFGAILFLLTNTLTLFPLLALLAHNLPYFFSMKKISLAEFHARSSGRVGKHRLVSFPNTGLCSPPSKPCLHLSMHTAFHLRFYDLCIFSWHSRHTTKVFRWRDSIALSQYCFPLRFFILFT